MDRSRKNPARIAPDEMAVIRGRVSRTMYMTPHRLHSEPVPHGPGRHAVETCVRHRVHGSFCRDIAFADIVDL